MPEATAEEILERAQTMIGKRCPVSPVQRLRLLARVRALFRDASTAQRIAVSDEAINRAFVHWCQTGERRPPADFVTVLKQEIAERMAAEGEI